MFSIFRRFRKKKPKPKRPTSLTEKLIVSMVADGMTYEEIQAAFPDISEGRLKLFVKKGLAKTGMFPD